MSKPILDDPLFDMSKAYIVPTVFQWVAERIRASDDKFLKSFLKQHEDLIESRADFTDCQKNARRKKLIEMYKNQQFMDYVKAGGKLKQSCGS